MTMLIIATKLIIELETIQAIILLVSMSTQAPRVLFSRVCCKQDTKQKLKEASQTEGAEKD